MRHKHTDVRTWKVSAAEKMMSTFKYTEKTHGPQ